MPQNPRCKTDFSNMIGIWKGGGSASSINRGSWKRLVYLLKSSLPLNIFLGGLQYRSSSFDGKRKIWRWQSRHIGFYDLVTPLWFLWQSSAAGGDSLGQAPTWYARTSLSLVVGMATVRTCRTTAMVDSRFHRRLSCIAVFALDLVPWSSH